MSLNLTDLTKYTDEHSNEIIKESILKGKTVDLVTVQPNVKYQATINKISTDIVAAAGGCGWSADGSTSLTQRVIAVNDIKINESICIADLEDYYTSTMMNPGSYAEDVPFEVIYTDSKKDKIQGLVEDLIWKGDITDGTGNLALADGFITLFDADATATASYTSASFSGSYAIDTIDAIVADVPVNIIDAEDLALLVGYAEYRAYAKALRDANLFHYNGDESNFEMMIPGTNVKLIALRGLNSTNRMVLTQLSNLVVGTDLLNDAEDFRIWYSQDNDEVRFLSKFKIGTQVAFIENVVYYTGV